MKFHEAIIFMYFLTKNIMASSQVCSKTHLTHQCLPAQHPDWVWPLPVFSTPYGTGCTKNKADLLVRLMFLFE